jgi:hypothetical protein
MKPLSHRGKWRFALGFLVTCLLGFGFLGYSQTSRGPALPEGEAQPTSQPRGGTPPALSVRLLERIEQSPGGTYGPSQFGSAIALNGDTLAVGASARHAMPGHQKGVVFVYQREGDGWAEIAQLIPGDEGDGFQTDLHFGNALALEGDTLAVGAPGARGQLAGNDSGAVYLFERRGSAWEQRAILHAADQTTGARFGERVVLREGVLAVSGGHNGGQAVYVFERAGEAWVERARLTGDSTGERDRFGHSLAIGGETLAVGAMDYDAHLERYTSYAVYLFRREGERWVRETKLAPSAEEEVGFGSSLAVEGNTLAVGVGDDAAGYGSGALYIYENGPQGWRQQARLVAGDASLSFFGSFGSAIALGGDLLAVGAAGDSSQGLWSGSAYLFRKQGESWIDVQKLWPDEQDYLGAFFGSDLELSGDTLLVAAPSEYGNAVYIYFIGTDGS